MYLSEWTDSAVELIWTGLTMRYTTQNAMKESHPTSKYLSSQFKPLEH